MRTNLRSVGALAAVLLCVAVVGACGGDDDSAQSLPVADEGGEDDSGGADSGGGGTGGGGAPGVPGGGSGGGAPGAPIDIPPITNLAGIPVDQVVEIFEERISDACDGDPCLVVDVEVQGDGENCEYSTDPPEGTSVPRESTVVIIADCPGDGEGETDSEGETDGEGETDTGTGTDTETEGTP